MEEPLKPALVAEVYGTFLLTFVGSTAITVATSGYFGQVGAYGLGFIGLAHGIALMVGIATVGAVSGAHFNPAVTIGLWSSGRFPRGRVLPYIGAQLVGATIAAAAELAVVGVTIAKTTNLGNPAPNASLPNYIPAALVAEVIGTMILTMTVLGSTDKGASSWAPVAIGLSLAASIWALGGISGASLNPARSFGPTFVSAFFNAGVFDNYWIYVIGPIAGALIASGIYRTVQRR